MNRDGTTSLIKGEIADQKVAHYFPETSWTVQKLETVDPELLQIFDAVLRDIFSRGLFESAICSPPDL